MTELETFIKKRIRFIQQHLEKNHVVGYYTGKRFTPIQPEELVEFTNALVVGTDWEDYIPITNYILYAYTTDGAPVAALPVPNRLNELVKDRY